MEKNNKMNGRIGLNLTYVSWNRGIVMVVSELVRGIR